MRLSLLKSEPLPFAVQVRGRGGAGWGMDEVVREGVPILSVVVVLYRSLM